MRNDDSKFTGLIGEHLVVSALLQYGIYAERTTMSSQPFDIIFTLDGRVYTVQVKTCKQGMFRKNHSESYFWNMDASAGASSGRYQSVDVFAFVALDTAQAWFVTSRELFAKEARRSAVKRSKVVHTRLAPGSLENVIKQLTERERAARPVVPSLEA